MNLSRPTIAYESSFARFFSNRSCVNAFISKRMGSTTIAAAIREARLDDDVKAVVLRVNSPGGSALASDIMWREV